MRKKDRAEDHGNKQTADTGTSILLATFDQYRSLLFSIAYRMLGSVADAEDMLQETFMRWQQSASSSIRSPRAFLVTIISRLCINQLQSARTQREEYIGQWLPEPIVTNLSNDPFDIIKIDESLSMAFLVLLERLTPVERAVFLLREVFEYEYVEIAVILEQSEANCRQILKRARQRIHILRPRFKASTLQQNDLLERFLQATSSGNMKDLISLLASDVVLYSDGGGKGIAVPNAVRGASNVGRGVIGGLARIVPRELTRRIAHINGKPGLMNYLDGKPHSVLTIDAAGDKIHAIYIVTNPEKLSHLPALPIAPS
jgi:RNA polymerase sigma-70 factor (ECF subfamily)